MDNIDTARKLLQDLENNIKVISADKAIQVEIINIIRFVAEFKYETLLDTPTKKQLIKILGERLSFNKKQYQKNYEEKFNVKIQALIVFLDFLNSEKTEKYYHKSPIMYW